MEEMTVVRFLADKGKTAKEKRRGSWQYFVKKQILQTPCGSLRLVTVQLPGKAYRNKKWKQQEWKEYLADIPVPPQDRYVHYLYDEEAKKMLCREEEPLSVEWLLFLMMPFGKAFDGLVLLWDRENETGELLEQHVRHCHYMAVVTKGKEADSWQNMLWEEYGFLLEVTQEVRLLHLPAGRKIMFVAGRELYGLLPHMLPEGAIYISMVTDGGGRNICQRAEDVKYLDIKCFLAGLLP